MVSRPGSTRARFSRLARRGRINPFWEIYWFSPEAPGEGHVVSTDFGVIAVVASRVALDASADIGLTDAAGQFTVGGGMSFLFGSRSKE